MATMLRVRQVLAKLGKTRSPLYSDISNGLFTRAVKLSARAAGWPEHEADAILNARIAGQSDDQIRKLVQRLHEQRKTAAGAGDSTCTPTNTTAPRRRGNQSRRLKVTKPPRWQAPRASGNRFKG